MIHSAKILPFPPRAGSASLSPKQAELAAADFLAIPMEERSDSERQRFLDSPDVLLAICLVLKRSRDLSPGVVLKEAVDIYRWISRPNCDLGLFDERDYFLGEMALIAGGVCRQLGGREDAFLWLDRAEAGFRHTLNPAPGLANVAYARLALRFEMGRHQDVMELAPSLEASFTKLRMEVEAAKCRLLLATTLKIAGHHSRALELLDRLHENPALASEPFLCARILAETGDLQQLHGDFRLAMIAFRDASNLLQGKQLSLAGADLKLNMAATYKALGSLELAEESYRAAQHDYVKLEARSLVAYTHLLIAETLLEMKRDREAEWEILAALPAIDEMKMVPEGFAAVALLRESVRRRQTDPVALKQLRAELQANS
jgi:tetratricopeptide (TPR) repeat protein